MACSVCGNDKALSSGKKYCKRCQADYQKKHYQSNKKYYRDKAREKQKQIQDLIINTKNVPCKDCGIKYPSYVMDYDHREDKKYNVAHMARIGSIRKFEDEIAKCDIVCSNCHRERTYKRKLALRITVNTAVS